MDQREEVLPVMDEAYEEFLDQFSDGVIVIDGEYHIISFSRGAERITGFKAGDVIGKVFDEVFHATVDEPTSPLGEVLRTGEPVSNRHTSISSADNAMIPISVSASPLRNARGSVVGLVISFRNELEIYQLTRELYKETSLLHSILNSIADGVLTIDTSWRITSFNPAAERITGYTREQVLGKSCNVVLASQVCSENCPLRRTIDTGETITNIESSIIDATGKIVPVSVNTALLRDDRGTIIGGVETFRDLSRIKQLAHELHEQYSFSNIVGKNPAMQRIYEIISTVSGTDSTVLILGETGTGKDLVAKAIHYHSPRHKEAFVKVSCAALPETLLESELFGYTRGAFTGAVRDKPGRFQLADGGTIFLDEIGDLSPTVQVKLLRILEEQQFEPLGATKPITVNVRIIAATNRDLESGIREGWFREDLYYRLQVVPITLPPLRQRKDDIPLLIDHFLKKNSKKMGKHITSVSREVLELMVDHPWTGNVRQLEHAIEYASIHCRGHMIQLHHLPEQIRALKERERGQDEKLSLEEAEKGIIERTLQQNGYSRSKTARSLKISRTTLWRKMKHHGID
jgi:PAS domain S-box-containing protein